VTIEPEFSLDQPRQINHLTPDGVLAKDSVQQGAIGAEYVRTQLATTTVEVSA